EPGAATLPENGIIRQTPAAGSRPRPTNRGKRATTRKPLPGGIYASPTNEVYASTKKKHAMPRTSAPWYRFLAATAFGPCAGAACRPRNVAALPVHGLLGVCIAL